MIIHVDGLLCIFNGQGSTLQFILFCIPQPIFTTLEKKLIAFVEIIYGEEN